MATGAYALQNFPIIQHVRKAALETYKNRGCFYSHTNSYYGQYKKRQTTMTSSTLIPYYDVSNHEEVFGKLPICVFVVFEHKEFSGGVGDN